jgi:polygalacturonase
LVLGLTCIPSVAQTNPWAQVSNILSRIIPPAFPAQDFVITNYGAIGNGTTDCTSAISNAIFACTTAGGGRVVVPAGTFLTGAIHLLNNVNLLIAAGGTIRFNTNTQQYLPVVFSRFQGTEFYNYSPFIYAFEQENIAVTGQGTIDGQASATAWQNWANIQTPDLNALLAMAGTNLPVNQRIFGAGHYLRPAFVQPVRCRNVLIEGVHLTNSPMWVVTPLYCTNVTIHAVTIQTTGPNTDGCDPDSSTDVLIRDCSFSDGDDCIAIKSGADTDGLRVAIPCQNVVIQNCIFQAGHGGVTHGSETSGGLSSVFAENCAFNSASLQYAMRFKTGPTRGGYIQNIYLRNCIVKTAQTGIHMTMQYTGAGTNYPVVRNIDIRDCVFAGLTTQPIFIQGWDATHQITDATITNCKFSPAGTSTITNATRINLINNRGT